MIDRRAPAGGLLLAALALGACQAFEPTSRTLREAPDVERDPTAPTVPVEPPAAPVELPAQHEPEPPVRPRIGDDRRVRLEFRGATLAGAVQNIAEAAAINVYFDAGLDRQVDAIFPSITLDDALHTLLARNDLRLVEDPPGIYHVESTLGAEIVERRFELANARASEVETGLRTLGLAAIQIVADVDQSFVLVRGARRDVDLVATFVAAADRLKQQVLIEMRIAEVTLSDSFQFGARIAIDDVDVGDGTAAVLQQLAAPTPEWQLSYTSSDGDLDATLRAIDRVAGVDLLSAPRVVAVDNSQASIEIIREVPYIQTTTNTDVGTSGGAGTQTTTEVAFKEVGVRLKVTPSIQQHGVIEFSVDQELSEVADFLQGVPAVNRRNLVTRFQVRDRETLVVGGLMADRRGVTDTGVPTLMDIPFLGALFKRDEDTHEKRELLVFLTPRIVDLGDAREVTDAWRQVFRERRREAGMDPAQAREHAALRARAREEAGTSGEGGP